MTIGVPKEVKTDEFRVGLTPDNVKILVGDFHRVLIESGAGEGSGFSNSDYIESGAEIVESAEILYSKSTLIVKVKEPQESEYELLNESHTLFRYLHLAPLKELTTLLVEKKVCAIAYETVSFDNELPLLKPMSEIAGQMAPVVGAYHLSRYQGGSGILIGGSNGVKPANVLIVGAGNAGLNAAKIAVGMGANVTVLNRSTPRLEQLKKLLPSVKTELFSYDIFTTLLKDSDIIISTVLIHGGAKTPKMIKRNMLKEMKEGSVVVDITIDQGGIAESSRATTHTNPVFIEEGIVHYCVANMPGAYPKTATIALTNATLPYIRELANEGCVSAIKKCSSLAKGVNVYNGVVTNRAVAELQNFEYKAIEHII